MSIFKFSTYGGSLGLLLCYQDFNIDFTVNISQKVDRDNADG